MATTRSRRWPPSSELDLLRNSQCIVYLDTEVSDSAFQFGVAEQDLNCPEVSGLLVDESRLRSSHRMRSIGARLKANASHPSSNNARILSSREMGQLATPAGEQITPSCSLHRWQPCGEGDLRLFGHFEPERAFRLLLDDRCSVPDRASGPKVLHSQSDEVTRAKLTVDCEIEQGQFARCAARLEADAN